MKLTVKSARRRRISWLAYRRNYDLYLLLIPSILFFAIFCYYPMYGVQIAFKNFSPLKGIVGSKWVGLKHFERFFRSYYFSRLIVNTTLTSVYQLALGFPIPILLALMMNEMRNLRYKKFIQTVTYLPHFLSTVVIVSLIHSFLAPKNGLINVLIRNVGGEPVYFMGEASCFKTIYVLSNIWQSMGWNSIIYVAALTGIDPTYYEAGRVDGASRWQMLLNITVPCLMPTATIMLILNCGRIMSIGFEKIFLMQNDLNIMSSEVISTYVYKAGLINAEYSFSSAVGLFNSVINCVLLVTVNWIAGKLGETRIF